MEEVVQIEEKIFEYVYNNTHADLNKITSQSLLFQEGIFDSMGFILLIDFLEEKFQIKANDNDLIEENFKSIASIANFIRNKQS